MKENRIKFEYVLIIEYADEQIGFILGTFHSEFEAKSMINHLFQEFENYYRYTEEELSPASFPQYQTYKITGDQYFYQCKKYIDRQSISNGNQTLTAIKCQGAFNVKAFIEYRNLPQYFGVMMN